MSTLSKSRAGQVATRDPLTLMRREMEDLFGRFWNEENRSGWFGGGFMPAVDVKEQDKVFELRLDLPGMDAKDIDVRVHGNTVTVSGERKEEQEEKGTARHRVERVTGAFSRTLTLPMEVNESEVAAEYRQGVLTLTLPKKEPTAAAKINIKT